MAEGEGKVLVEEVPEEAAHTQVGPTTVHQQQPLEEAELGHRKVRGQHRLHALLATDAHSYVCHCVVMKGDEQKCVCKLNKTASNAKNSHSL